MTTPSKTSAVNSRLLSDKLIDVADGIRRRVHCALGTRPYSVAIITRRWSGRRRGEGSFKDSILVLDPVPAVKRSTSDRLGPAGREGSGGVKLEGISLRYSYDELMPRADDRTEVAWRISELHGQHQGDRWFIPDGDPIPRRGDNPGDASDWVISLHETSALTNVEKVDSP